MRSINVLCDSCYRLFPYERVVVQCNSGSETCRSVRYVDDSVGPRRMQPGPVGLWAKKGRRLALDRPCPECRNLDVLVPACPNADCRAPLHPEIGQVEDCMVGILGARKAGKSHFLAALLHGLLRQNLGGEVWRVHMEEADRRLAEGSLIQPFFEGLRELPRTPVRAELGLRLILEHVPSRRRVLLRFQDLSGETMSRDELLAKADFLRYAAGLIVLADPLSFEPPARGQRRAWYHDEPTYLDILDGYLRMLRAAPRHEETVELPLLPEQKVLAVVVSKADLVRSSGTPFWEPVKDDAYLESGLWLESGYWSAREAESTEARSWLQVHQPLNGSAGSILEHFQDVSYFFASSYGREHRPTAVLRKPPAPLRVHEPFFALLDRLVETPAASPGLRERWRRGPSHQDSRPRSRPEPQTLTDDDVL